MPAPAAERRFVTVLFADLVGFTTLSDAEDPEAVRDLLSRYFEVARQTIEGYGGSVEKFIGDAVMAVWGAPVAQEDDPERAVRAALELVARVSALKIGDQQLQLRAGVLSGEAAVTAGRTGEGMVAGDLVNTASRLQSVAPPGVVLVGEGTQSATSAAVVYEVAGDQLLKGKSAPVKAWRALRVVARVGGGGRDEGLEPPFVGRDEELRLLQDQLHAAEREKKLRMVSVIGLAGMGKSRLVWELEKYLDGIVGPQLYYWHQGRSPAYGEGITYWALGEMVRRRAGSAEGEDDATTRQKLCDALDEFVPDAEERAWLEPALGALLGIDDVRQQTREQLYSAWRTFFERVSEKGPVVLVFEDIQWADSGLLDFIEHLLEWTRDKPMLIVTLARPEILERRPNFGLGHRAFAALHLEPLPDDAMRALLTGLVPGLRDEDLANIVARAEGVPLYAVETVRTLVDQGHLVREGNVYAPIGELPVIGIPPTLRALIASRLDALDATDRTLVQDAAVIGTVFAVPTLAVLSGRDAADVQERLRALCSREFVALETDPRSPERGQYRFTQALLREVAYNTLARRERRSRHLSAARYLEALGDDELAGILASHYTEAYRAAPEGEEGAAVAAQARVALRAAAERAARLHSNEQALAYFEQALSVTFDEADRMELRAQAADSAVALGHHDRAIDHLRAAYEFHRTNGNRLMAGALAGRLARGYLYASRIDDAMALIPTALAELAGERNAAVVSLNGELARAHLFRDEPELGLRAVSNALEIAEELRVRNATIHLLITKSWALSGLGRIREATALLLGAMRIADDEAVLSAQSRARYNLSSYYAVDDPHEGRRIALEGVALQRQFGIDNASMAGNAASNMLIIGDLDGVLQLEQDEAGESLTPLALGILMAAAVALSLRGDIAGTERRLAVVRDAEARSSSRQDISAFRFVEGFVSFGAGRLEDARRQLLESHALFKGAESPHASVLAARISALRGDTAALRDDRAMVAESVRYGAWLERGLEAIDAAQLALEGRPAEAVTAFRRVIDLYRAHDLRFDLAMTLLTRARLLGATDDEARAGRDEAADILDRIGARGLIDRIEAALPEISTARTGEQQPVSQKGAAAATR